MASTTTKIGNLRGPAGPAGPTGATGAPGANGATGQTGAAGARGASVFSGNGAPSAAIIAQAVAGQDSYLDLVSGDTYSFA